MTDPTFNPRDFQVTAYPQGLYSVSIVGPVIGIVCGAGSLDGGDSWWINRVLIAEQYQRHGLGTKLLNLLKEYVQAYDNGKASVIFVSPGGYSTPLVQQQAFYYANGYRFVDPVKHHGLMWLPLKPIADIPPGCLEGL